MKQCTKCGETKTLSQFHKSPKTPSGRCAACKECRNTAGRDYTKRNLHIRRAWRKANARKIAASARKWYEKNSHKRAAHRKLRRAVLAGVVSRGRCETCGARKVEGHHTNYARPLDVRWFCKPCHEDFHRKLELRQFAATRRLRRHDRPTDKTFPVNGFRQ